MVLNSDQVNRESGVVAMSENVEKAADEKALEERDEELSVEALDRVVGGAIVHNKGSFSP